MRDPFLLLDRVGNTRLGLAIAVLGWVPILAGFLPAQSTFAPAGVLPLVAAAPLLLAFANRSISRPGPTPIAADARVRPDVRSAAIAAIAGTAVAYFPARDLMRSFRYDLGFAFPGWAIEPSAISVAVVLGLAYFGVVAASHRARRCPSHVARLTIILACGWFLATAGVFIACALHTYGHTVEAMASASGLHFGAAVLLVSGLHLGREILEALSGDDERYWLRERPVREDGSAIPIVNVPGGNQRMELVRSAPRREVPGYRDPAVTAVVIARVTEGRSMERSALERMGRLNRRSLSLLALLHGFTVWLLPILLVAIGRLHSYAASEILGEPCSRPRRVLHLVPLGTVGGAEVDDLAERYSSLLTRKVKTLPGVPLSPLHAGRQLFVESLLTSLRTTFAHERSEGVLVAITDRDITSADGTVGYVFAQRDDWAAVVSTARLHPDVFGPKVSPALTDLRFRARREKMITKNVLLLLCDQPSSADPESGLYGSIDGPVALDAMTPIFPPLD